MIRETYDDPYQDTESVQSTWAGSRTSDAEHCGLTGIEKDDCEHSETKLVGTELGDHKQPEKVQLSKHCREYAAYPIQTKLKD